MSPHPRPVEIALTAFGALTFVLAVCLAPRPAVAGAFVRLTDGRTLEGESVRREGDVYLLQLPGGNVITLPVGTVAEVGLKGAPEPPPPAPSLAGPPTGLTAVPAGSLAGPEVRPSTPADQLAVFGEPAKFAQSPVVSGFAPQMWEMDPAENNWNPSKWAKSPTDPNWQPTSAFDTSKDVLEASRSQWAQAPTDSSWQPTDGFQKKPF